MNEAANRVTDRFLADANQCRTLDALGAVLAATADELGFSHFALLHHVTLGDPQSRYLQLHNYPREWVTELERKTTRIEDPVHLACRRTGTAFIWKRLSELALLDARQEDLIADSRRHGLGDGFTVPVHIPGEPAGSCSFVVRDGDPLPNHRLICSEIVGLHAFDIARRIAGHGNHHETPHLSRRELECVRLVARGKTDWEIAVILGISAHTARQYLKRARQAYDVASRTQLVVLGLRDAWLSIDEIAPPAKPGK